MNSNHVDVLKNELNLLILKSNSGLLKNKSLIRKKKKEIARKLTTTKENKWKNLEKKL